MILLRTPVVLLDVGFTLTFLDGPRIAAVARGAGVVVDGATIVANEPLARRELSHYAWAATPDAASRNPALAEGGARFFARVLALCDARGSATDIERAGWAVWREHLKRNVWARVGRGVSEALDRLHAAGVRCGVVSNSEGTVGALLEDVGLAGRLETIVDSWRVGVAKPDSRIFQLALDRLGVEAPHATMVGDSLVNDVGGAERAGLQAAWLDPFSDSTEAERARVFRFADLPSFVDAFLGGSRALS